MRLPDGTEADVTGLEHDAGDTVTVTMTVKLPDGRTMIGFASFQPSLVVTAGALKAPGIGITPPVKPAADDAAAGTG